MCANTVYEKGEVSFTRYWAGDQDGIQITFRGQAHQQGYVQMTFKDFQDAYFQALGDVEATSDAWWHSWDNEKKK